MPTGNCTSVDTEWENFRVTVENVAEEVVQAKISGNMKKKKTVWWTKEVEQKGGNSNNHSIKNEDGTELLTEPEEISQRWGEYFDKLLNVEEEEGGNDYVEVINNVEMNYGDHDDGDDEREVTEDVTNEVILMAIRKMKNGKAVGEDGLPVEVFKTLEEVGVEWLARAFNTAWNQGKIPYD
ncbi:uncharacterized protein LOC143037003 [Oratosquilla oratoria]|uniref:uncharacterized protein LOC143037003 n=1 Tax=Oratosquilla oratoria TaxID=337810 RepID=UPI003F76D8EC